MKIEIGHQISGIFRVYYNFGRSETSVPFKTYEEAEAFQSGLEHAIHNLKCLARKHKLTDQQKEDLGLN